LLLLVLFGLLFTRILLLPQCGCVLSETALKNVPDTSACLSCGKPYQAGSEILLNPDNEEYEAIVAKFEEDFKAKRKAKRSTATTTTTTTSTTATSSTSATTTTTADGEVASASDSASAMTTSNTAAQVEITESQQHKKRKADTSPDASRSSKRAKRAAAAAAAADTSSTSTTAMPTFLTKNPNELKKIDTKHQKYLKSAAYASLFVSSTS
jgi:hypothetical protein